MCAPQVPVWAYFGTERALVNAITSRFYSQWVHVGAHTNGDGHTTTRNAEGTVGPHQLVRL